MYLGLDCGTSGLKALLVDEAGEAVAGASRAYLPDRPRPGWSEQDPEVWRAAMAGAIAERSRRRPKSARRPEGDRLFRADARRSSDRPLGPPGAAGDPAQRRPRPCGGGRTRPRLSPSGQRRRREADARASPGRSSCGSSATSPSLWAGSIACWRRRTILRLALTGERGTDMSDAAGQWLLDEAARRWSEEAFAACGADPGWAPLAARRVGRGRDLASRRRRGLGLAARRRDRGGRGRRRASARSASARSRRARRSFRSAPRRS